MEIELRDAAPDDWKDIQRLNHEVITSNLPYDGFLRGEYAYTPSGEQYYQEVTSKPTYICIVAHDAGNLVGYIVGSKKDLTYRTVKTLELNDMGVTPSYRSRGIGAKLVAELKSRAKAAGYETMYVNAYAKNTRAIDFYKRLGFAPIDMSLEVRLV